MVDLGTTTGATFELGTAGVRGFADEAEFSSSNVEFGVGLKVQDLPLD